ncbi:hypothetical protein NDU88_012882 [Pleurodeles waltl]|uniref:Uncharacterized protein n=1 Tax=Pleurodeles waltl TaxID=8319 RepID=A0AAV7R424_PLEWA|nr:hypothetical protein NDU88_012882 [Pleurodeles waltl]
MVTGGAGCQLRAQLAALPRTLAPRQLPKPAGSGRLEALRGSQSRGLAGDCTPRAPGDQARTWRASHPPPGTPQQAHQGPVAVFKLNPPATTKMAAPAYLILVEHEQLVPRDDAESRVPGRAGVSVPMTTALVLEQVSEAVGVTGFVKIEARHTVSWCAQPSLLGVPGLQYEPRGPRKEYSLAW